MYLTPNDIQKKYGIAPAHCYRDLVEQGECRTKPYIFCNRKCTSYYEPDVIEFVKQKKKRAEETENRYKNRPNVMRGTKSQLKKVLDKKTYVKLRNAWYGMMRRCYTDERPDYHHYREFGITICDEWLNNFDSFALWSLNNGMEEHLTLDRIDNNEGYSPDNCRWVSKKIQNNNTSVNRTLTFRGEEKTLSEWADTMGLNYDVLWARIKAGWSVERALTTPLLRQGEKG